jgi:hypothetical protein
VPDLAKVLSTAKATTSDLGGHLILEGQGIVATGRRQFLRFDDEPVGRMLVAADDGLGGDGAMAGFVLLHELTATGVQEMEAAGRSSPRLSSSETVQAGPLGRPRGADSGVGAGEPWEGV